METVLASRNSTERKGEPEIDFVGPVYSNRTGIPARGRATVLPVNDTSPELRPADAGKPGKVRTLVETGLGAGASLLLGRAGMKMTASLVWREKATDALVRMSAAALLVGRAAAAQPPPPSLPPSSPLTDCEILLEMYNTMGGANWQKGASRIEWDVTEPSNCCAWEGVRCHADRPGDDIGIVERIWLQEVEGMSGTLPGSIVRLGARGKLRRAHPQLRLCREGM